jgi:hypothetical protein
MPWSSRAALNNAEWCDAVACSQGIATELGPEAWIARTRTPPCYPDAVTLVADLALPDLLRRIDATAGCSIKDSFASLDLQAHGFRVLFEARWIAQRLEASTAANDGAGWVRVRDAAELAAWEAAWSGESDHTRPLLRADLLALDTITVLAAHDADRIVAGAVLSRSAEVIGVGNLFSLHGRGQAWPGCLAFASAMYPGATLVGYESGDDLDIALAHGFEAQGPLRVWMRD